jgi:chromosomal replication initiator protein
METLAPGKMPGDASPATSSATQDSSRGLAEDLARALRHELGPDRFELYFADTAFRVADGGLQIEAENEFALSQIRNRFGAVLQRILAEQVGMPVDIRYGTAMPTPREQAELFSAGELQAAAAASASISTATSTASGASRRQRERLLALRSAAAGTKPQQMEMFAAADGREQSDGPVRADGRERGAPASREAMSLATFQFGAANRLAQAATDQVIQRPGQISPLVLFGPVGSGKTHLSTGLGQHLKRRMQSYSVLQLSAEQFTTRFLQALNGSGLPSLRAQFRDVDLLILEDIQFFQGKKATLVELQHTIDSLLRMGKQLILTMDRHPNDLNFLSAEIQTRLVSGLVIPLQAADRDARAAICQHWCQQWRLTLADGMIDWLADHVSGDTRRLSGALFRLLAVQSSRGQQVQPHEAMEILSDYAGTHQAVCSLAMIQKAVCNLCGVEPTELNGSGRTRKISAARMLAMYLARKHTPSALSEIGAFFGGRRHSTVVAAEKRIRAWVQKNESLDTASRAVNLREAIRQVETQLKTG